MNGRIFAVLGPTNTGKTHFAIERMLARSSGIIGLPLRLLAREVYDRIVALRGPSVVALLTGEERIVPPRAKYWVCTVEAMPRGMGADFLAVDEIQLCGDPERGHVFTDRLLHARGTHETLFLGAGTMREAIRDLIPEAEFISRDRMSELSWAGSKKISRMPARSAIVGFSVENLYASAELLRRQHGGAAVVMGALSPRTRNAQVALYQNGDVDYLVATDAIGMGLNLDINHVAFSGLSKFDGRRMRPLYPHEIGQIAGRAGRHMNHGTFGVTGDAPLLEDGLVEAICTHRFAPLKKLEWRNARLQFGTAEALISSLEQAPDDPRLVRARDADDLIALRALAADTDIRARLNAAPDVRLLWDVCCVPDFRGISTGEHSNLLRSLFAHLLEGALPQDWLARQIKRLDRVDGDIDVLSKRLAFIRTWTYVSQRKNWTRDENHWRGVTRAVEDRLSDALHAALTQRFVDRRTSVLMRRLKQKESLVAEVNDKGEVTVEGHIAGRLDGFRFSLDKSATGEEAKTLKTAAYQSLAPEFSLRSDRFYNAPDTEIDFTEQGGLMWGEYAVGKLVKGDEALKPRAVAFVDDEAGAEVAEKVARRLQHFVDRKIANLFEPMLAMSRDETLTGLARGFAFRLIEGLGILPRSAVANEVRDLDQDARGLLRKHGVRFGQFTVFMPLLLKPAPTRLRLVLWALFSDHAEFAQSPPPGLVTIPSDPSAAPGFHTIVGYREAGERAIRIDMLERLADMLRGENSRAGFEANADMLSITGMTLVQFADLMAGLGYKAEQGTREKLKPAPAAQAPNTSEASVPAAETSDSPEASGAADAPVAPETDTPEADTPETPETSAPDAPVATADETNAPDPGASDAKTAEATPENVSAGASAGAEDAGETEPEIEVFYTFTWGRAPRGKPGQNTRRDAESDTGDARGRRDGKPGGKPGGKSGRKPGGKPGRKPTGADKGQKPQSWAAKPAKKDKIDPDNPFAAALMGLKDKD